MRLEGERARLPRGERDCDSVADHKHSGCPSHLRCQPGFYQQVQGWHGAGCCCTVNLGGGEAIKLFYRQTPFGRVLWRPGGMPSHCSIAVTCLNGSGST